NRDFPLGRAFATATGGRLPGEGTVVDLYGTPALLMHGASLCTRDEKCMAVRAQVSNPDWQADMLARPLAQRRMIAQMLRLQSKQNNENKAQNIMDVTPEEVIRVMDEAGVKDLIHGHTHRPAVHDVSLQGGSGKRWVLGDWGALGWQIVADQEKGLRLERFTL